MRQGGEMSPPAVVQCLLVLVIAPGIASMIGTQPLHGPKHTWNHLQIAMLTSMAHIVKDGDKSRCSDIGPQDMGEGTIFQCTCPKWRVANTNFSLVDHHVRKDMILDQCHTKVFNKKELLNSQILSFGGSSHVLRPLNTIEIKYIFIITIIKAFF